MHPHPAQQKNKLIKNENEYRTNHDTLLLNDMVKVSDEDNC
jgi:tRNA1(Val) A37 N6-methylase TrmN6